MAPELIAKSARPVSHFELEMTRAEHVGNQQAVVFVVFQLRKKLSFH
jgi:hypothetical protein